MQSGVKRIQLKMTLLSIGMSQRRCGSIAGINETRFSSILCGWLNPTNDERLRILAAIGKTSAESAEIFGPDRELIGQAPRRSPSRLSTDFSDEDLDELSRIQ